MAICKRLLKIAEMMGEGGRVADIGTDHAYLPIFLITKGKASYCYACDVASGPLCNARENIEKSGVKNIELRRGDGLCAVKPSEFDTAVIAGMGGDLIISILEAAPFIKDKRYTLLLQPMTSAEELRKYLIENGFAIEDERAVTSAGRIYTVIKAGYTGEISPCGPLFYYFGKLTENIGDDEAVYIRRKRRIIAELANDIETVKGKEELFTTLKSVAEKTDRILKENGY